MAEKLTCGERLTRCLTGEPVDRVPFGIGLGWRPWGQTLAKWREELGDPRFNVAKACGYDPGWAVLKVHAGIFPPFEPVVLEENERYKVHRDERGITRRSLKVNTSMAEFLDFPVKTKKDWERLKEERLRIEDTGRIAIDWEKFRASIRDNGQAVQVGAFPFGVFGTPRDLMGFERLLIGFYECPELIRDMMEHLTTLWLSQWERVAAETPIHHIHIWEDMSGRQGSLISPKMVRDFMMPCYDRIVAFARRHGVPIVSVDTDGDCRQLVPVMMEHGINMFFPFEVQAGNDILDIREKYPHLGMIGGLDKRALAGTRAEVDREIERAARMMEKGRYIPAFDHAIPSDARWESFQHAAVKIRQLCHAIYTAA